MISKAGEERDGHRERRHNHQRCGASGEDGARLAVRSALRIPALSSTPTSADRRHRRSRAHGPRRAGRQGRSPNCQSVPRSSASASRGADGGCRRRRNLRDQLRDRCCRGLRRTTRCVVARRRTDVREIRESWDAEACRRSLLEFCRGQEAKGASTLFALTLDLKGWSQFLDRRIRELKALPGDVSRTRNNKDPVQQSPMRGLDTAVSRRPPVRRRPAGNWNSMNESRSPPALERMHKLPAHSASPILKLNRLRNH